MITDTCSLDRPYTVASRCDYAAERYEGFIDLDRARAYAGDLAAQGFECVVQMTIAHYPARERDDYGVTPGVDYPASLHPRAEVVRM